ncbi:glutamate-cysteine ligase family protein, partial [Planotetraspora thailandica]
EAMAAYLGVPYGITMMCSTASIQVNVDVGGDPARRWNLAHALGPVLVAAFANSPADGWMSGRQRVWASLDSSRTAPVSRGGVCFGAAGDPAGDWARYLLDAGLMMIHEGGDAFRPVPPGPAFRDFAAVAGRPPTRGDLAYHATTLFPPVRPRGWLEVRYLDALGPDDWPVCAAVVSALLMDGPAAEEALDAAVPFGGWWTRAARLGLADPDLRRAAETCFRAVVEALPRLDAEPWLVDRVAAYAVKHIETGRSPAADLLEEMSA